MKRLKKPLILKKIKKGPNKAFIFGFTYRQFGNMTEDNLRNLANLLSFSPDGLVSLDQVHSGRVVFTRKAGLIPKTDGVVTDEKNLLLVVRAADCLPVLLFDLKKEIIGVCHAGRRGLVKKILKKTIIKLVKSGSQRPDIKIIIGPHIKTCCYPTDLGKIAFEQIKKANINIKNVTLIDKCTCCQENFFSYRKNRKKLELFSGFIGIKTYD